ncbi:MAG: FtsX-like permease family protein, partial [Lachnospiraceae bacterium]|nr:FtsX-like permease family protein [Lachnospiraceae bacterium]
MKSYYTLAWREIMGQKRVSLLIIIAIIISSTMTTAVGQSVGILDAMRRQQAIAIGGDRYASFVQLTETQAQALERDERLSYTGRYVQVGSTTLNDLLKLDLVEYWGDGLCTLPAYTRLAEGRLPQSPMEIVLSEDALQFLGFTGTVGDTISLSLSKALRHGVEIEAYEYEADFVLTGIIQNNYLGYVYGSIRGFVGEGSASVILPQMYLYYCMDIKTTDKKNFQAVVDELAESLGIHELDTIYNAPYLNALGIHYSSEEDGIMLDDNGFPFVMFAGVLAALLILLAAGLVIFNIFKIAVTRRIGQYGVLRAIGAEKGQLYRIVAAEILLLCMCGIPAGLLLGLLSSEGILAAVFNQLSPEMFLAQDTAQLQMLIAQNASGKWGYLVVSVCIALLSAFLAAAPAAHFAAKVSPVAAMRSVASYKAARRKTRTIRNFERYYAALNLSRNRSRTVVTVLSLVMSITVFVTLQSYLSHLSVAGAESEHLGDYSVVNLYDGFLPEELARMEADANVSAVAAQQVSLYNLDEQYQPVGIETDFSLGIGECFQIFGSNEYWASHLFQETLTEEQWSAWKAGEGCIVRNPIPMTIEGMEIGTTHLEAGSTIMIAGRKLSVLKTLDGYEHYFSVGNNGFMNGVQVLVSDRLYPQLTGKDSYAELRPVLRADARREVFDGALDSLCARAAGTTWVS